MVEERIGPVNYRLRLYQRAWHEFIRFFTFHYWKEPQAQRKQSNTLKSKKTQKTNTSRTNTEFHNSERETVAAGSFCSARRRTAISVTVRRT